LPTLSKRGSTRRGITQKEADDFRKKFEQLESAKAGYQFGRDFQSVRSADRYLKLRKEIHKKVKGDRASTLTVGAEASGAVKVERRRDGRDVRSVGRSARSENCEFASAAGQLPTGASDRSFLSSSSIQSPERSRRPAPRDLHESLVRV
jgi:hypothetical protein